MPLRYFFTAGWPGRWCRRWLSRKFYASFMNIKEFMADSLGRELLGIVSDALDAD